MPLAHAVAGIGDQVLHLIILHAHLLEELPCKNDLHAKDWVKPAACGNDTTDAMVNSHVYRTQPETQCYLHSAWPSATAAERATPLGSDQYQQYLHAVYTSCTEQPLIRNQSNKSLTNLQHLSTIPASSASCAELTYTPQDAAKWTNVM